MKYSLITTACVLFACFQPGCQSQLNQANNLDDNIESKIDALLEKMTLEEKIGQMSQATGFRLDAPKDLESEARKGNVGSFLNIAEVELRNKLQKNAIEKSRLGIPLIFGYDVIHGHRTVFPVPLGEAASWNLDMMEKTASISAKEARADGIDWTFSPMIDIARDPRWGRVVEGAGEDTYLGSLISRAKVRGYQGNNLSDPDTVAACLKHFAVYGASQAGREYHTTEVPLRTIRDVYLPPFKAGVEEGAVTLMSGFNDLNGVPTSGNKFLLTDILRNEWGFDGFVVSDWCSVRHMIPHSFAKDETHAGILAVTAGVDMEMVSRTFIDNLPRLVREGTVSEDLLDTAVRRILRVKFQLGLFDNPYVDPKLQETVILAPEHREVARQAVRESMVLLKNENALLPLNESIKSIALIGPLADNQKDLLGTWVLAAKEENVITLKQGLENAVGKTCKINYTKGCETDGDSTEGFAEAIETAQNSDLVIMAVGESEIHNGEAHSRTNLDLPGVQLQLLKEIRKTGKPIVMVLFAGRPLTINWELENIPAILLAWHPGVEGGNGITDVLFFPTMSVRFQSITT
ncbi:MAG: glycoside hydrolase family 3 N-terminal domain-containing protein [Planctomycetota bacterium]|jgi:beta-glucosidase